MIHKVEDFKLSDGFLLIRRDTDGPFEPAFCPFTAECCRCGHWCALFGGIRIEQYTDGTHMNMLDKKVVHLCHTTLMCKIHNKA